MTDNHNYNTPAQGAADWHTPLNENFTNLDADVTIRTEEAADPPANYTPHQDAVYIGTDTGNVYLGDGSAWTLTWVLRSDTTFDEQAQDAIGQNLTNGLTYDDTTPTVGLDVVVNGQVTLSGGTAAVDTNVTATDATFMLALGIDDPNADAKVSGRLFWDDSDGSYWIEIVEDGTSVGNPTVNYDVIRVR